MLTIAKDVGQYVTNENIENFEQNVTGMVSHGVALSYSCVPGMEAVQLTSTASLYF